jgi:hypothetical protein
MQKKCLQTREVIGLGGDMLVWKRACKSWMDYLYI